MKTSGYYECYKRVEKARTATPVNTKELEDIRDLYGYDLYRECLREVILTIERRNASELPDFNSPEAFFCEPD